MAEWSTIATITKSLAPGCLIGLVQLRPGEILRISADDLAEMYYTFQVPDSRARRNCIRIRFQPHELKHLSCFDPSKHNVPCYVALGALAMGDSLAVEIAQQAHFQVLSQLAGSLRDHERVAYRKPFPRGKFFEFLAIDDHLGLQGVNRQMFQNGARCRDTEVFERAERAYKIVGLVQHPKKKRRGVTSGIVLGSEVDGVLGRVSAPRHRICLLMLCTALIAKKGVATPHLLSSVVGSWVSVLLYRRPIMSVMSAVFLEGRGLPANQTFTLSRPCRNELMCLSILGPLAQTDLRTKTCPKVFCMDASPAGSGICQVPESAAVVSELWRHSEQRGFYAKLSSPAAAVLSELGIDPEPAFGGDKGFHLPQQTFPPPRCLREGFLFETIELFKKESTWTLAHAELGFKTHCGPLCNRDTIVFDDMLDPSVFHELCSLALRRVVRDWHFGPPSLTFATFKRPRARSRRWPSGFMSSDELTSRENTLARRTAFLMSIALLCGAFVSVEQAGSSVMFYMHIFKVLASLGCVLSKFCLGAYGSAFKKPSKWLHNKPWLLELEATCHCASPEYHCIIQGSFSKVKIREFEGKCKPSSEAVYGRAPRLGESVAAYSALYPLTLTRRMALGSLNHKEGQSVIIPAGRKLQTLCELGLLPKEHAGSLSSVHPAWREWHEDPDWIGELADSLHFKELLRYKFAKPGHINVQEFRTYKTWLKFSAKHHPDSRLLALLDSRVTLGAAAKGRSSSFALSRVLQGSLGYVLGGGLYPGGLHVPTDKNRSDGPSRNRPVLPASKEEPLWLQHLRAGHYETFDAVLSAASVSRLPGRWLRLLLLLGGDIETNPGPPPPRKPRGTFDLSLGLSHATALRHEQCVRGFAVGIEEHCQCSPKGLTENVHATALALRGYGCISIWARFSSVSPCLFYHGHPRIVPPFSRFSVTSWQIDRKWQLAEPGECRPVISAPILKAALAVASLWGWHTWLAVTMIGFLGMLHPAEFLALKRQDLVLARDAMLERPDSSSPPWLRCNAFVPSHGRRPACGLAREMDQVENGRILFAGGCRPTSASSTEQTGTWSHSILWEAQRFASGTCDCVFSVLGEQELKSWKGLVMRPSF